MNKVDCSLLPPCRKVLAKKMQRVNYISQLWGNANKINPTEIIRPSDYGWKDSENGLEPVWHEGPLIPQQIEKAPETEVIESLEDEVWSDDSHIEES